MLSGRGIKTGANGLVPHCHPELSVGGLSGRSDCGAGGGGRQAADGGQKRELELSCSTKESGEARLGPKRTRRRRKEEREETSSY